MKKLAILFSIFAAVSLGGFFCTEALQYTQEAEEKEFTIVTSFYPVYIATENVVDGIDHVKLVNLTENHSGCLHDYQLTTADMRTLENADLFIMNGGGMESFVEEIAEQYPNLTIIDASDGIQFLEPEDHEHGEEDADGHEQDEEVNAHVWMNPILYEKQIVNIADGLKEMDSVRKEAYTDNQEEYISKINQVMDEYEELLYAEGKKVITFHDAFAYLAQFMKLDVSYSVDLDEDSGLSAGQIAEVIDRVNTDGVRILFTEKQYRDSIAANVSQETDASVYVLDSLVSGENSKDAYIKGMKNNLVTIRKALKEAGEVQGNE